MKICILLFVFGLAAADFWQDATAPYVDNAVKSFLEGFGERGSLRSALNLPYAVELDDEEDEMKKEVGNKLKDTLNGFLERIKDKVNKGKDVAEQLIAKVREIKDKLKEMKEDAGEKAKGLLQKLKEKAKDKLKELLEKYNLAKRSLDDETELIERSTVHDIIERLREKLLNNETIRKIREYIRNFVTTNPELQKIKEFLLKLREVDLKELLRTIFERHPTVQRGETWDKVKDWFKNLKDKVGEHTRNMLEKLKEKLNDAKEKLKGHAELIKALAKDLIAHGKDIHGELAREVIEFFQPYKEDLGSLWKELFQIAKDGLKG